MFFTVTKLQTLIIDTDDFRTDPQLLQEIVQCLDLVLKVILVTRSNRPHDAFENRTTRPKNTTEHLRYNALLKRIMIESKTPPASTVLLCRDRLTLELARTLLIGTVVFTNQTLPAEERFLLYQESPDYVVTTLDALLKCLSLEDQGFVAEIESAPNRIIESSYNYSSPAVLETPPSPPSLSTPPSSPPSASNSSNSDSSPVPEEDLTARIVELPNLEYPDCPIFVMGRYFGPGDPRHQIHALSLRILKFKRHHLPHLDIFGKLFTTGIEVATDGAYDLITQVPSRPEVGDRLGYLLSNIKQNSTIIQPDTVESNTFKSDIIRPDTINPDAIQPDILRCVKTYPSLKGLNLQSRRANVAKVFSVQKDVQGKRIVIIDDVITTGATINACIEQLKAAGASSITCVFLAYHPYAIKTRPFEYFSCYTCEEPLDVKFESDSDICFECHHESDSEAVHSKLSFSDALNDRLGQSTQPILEL
ncbi:MAG: ComF family protein [Candidatus Melainabacteria bacterium]|nr:MAG: ComF family protein [Candidatus Melainabacteria bacterium]